MYTLGSILGDWKNQMWRGKGIPSASPHVSGSAHPITVICIYFGCVGRMAQRQIWESALFSFLLVFDLEHVNWSASQTAKPLVGTPRRWRCANDFDIRQTGRCCKKGPECHESLPRGTPIWLGRPCQEGLCWKRWLRLRVLGVMGDTGNLQAFFLTIQELNHITPETFMGHWLRAQPSTDYGVWGMGLVMWWSIAQMHTAQEKALELYQTGFQVCAGDFTEP